MRRQCARCGRELATGQAVCVCGSEQTQQVEHSSVATFGKITALEAAEQELWKRCA